MLVQWGIIMSVRYRTGGIKKPLIIGQYLHMINVPLNAALGFKNVRFHVVKDSNMKEETVIDQNVVAFQAQNVLQVINLQVNKSVDLNVFLIGIQDRIIIIY